MYEIKINDPNNIYKEYIYDFNKIISMPPELNITHYYDNKELVQKITKELKDENLKETILNKLNISKYENNIDLNINTEKINTIIDYITNTINWGYGDWYEWRLYNWGCHKQPDVYINKNTNQIKFKTNIIPEPLLYKMAYAQNRTIEIEIIDCETNQKYKKTYKPKIIKYNNPLVYDTAIIIKWNIEKLQIKKAYNLV